MSQKTSKKPRQHKSTSKELKKLTTKKSAPRELPAWKDRSTPEKVCYIVVLALAIIVIIAFIIDLIGNTLVPLSFYFGALSLAILADAAIYWKYNRPIAVAMLICGVTLIITTIVAIMLSV